MMSHFNVLSALVWSPVVGAIIILMLNQNVSKNALRSVAAIFIARFSVVRLSLLPL